MKEIRHAKKVRWLTYAELETLAMNEIKERNDFPDRLKLPIGNLDDGISNGKGWVLQGFIEDAAGILRLQTFEESSSCIGCHGGIGATIDSTFSYARKLDVSAFQRGWFHWSQKDLKGINEPKKEGSDKRQVTQGPAIHGWPMWHPDSTRLVYWGYNRLNGKSSIISCRLDGGGKMKLIESEEALDRPMWRPDGKYIAYAAQQAGNWDIWVMTGDGNRQYRMTYDAQMETNPLLLMTW